MRPLPFVVFLLAGCLGSSASTAPVALEPSAPMLEVVVVDQEFVPVAGAIVTIEGNDTVHRTSAEGHVAIPAPDGPVAVKAWAPSYYRNKVDVEASGESRKVEIRLERRPDDARFATHEREEGMCYVGVALPAVEPRSCLPPPQCWFECEGPASYVKVGLSQPDMFRNLTLRLSWEAGSALDALAFLVDVKVPLARDPSSFILEGPSPIVFELAKTDLALDTDLPKTLTVVSSIADTNEDGTPRIVHEQPFVLDAYVVFEYQAPPSIPW